MRRVRVDDFIDPSLSRSAPKMRTALMPFTTEIRSWYPEAKDPRRPPVTALHKEPHGCVGAIDGWRHRDAMDLIEGEVETEGYDIAHTGYPVMIGITQANPNK
jgi:hypothetical protein